MRFGLIGYGAWGRQHAQAINNLPGLELVGIACRNAATAEVARRDFPSARVTTDYADLLRDPSIETVDIVVPNYMHAEIGCAALAAGKHVLLEKPLATSVEGCDRLIAAARASGRVLSVGHEFRQSTQWGRVKEDIDAGQLGTPRFVNVSLFRNSYRTGAENWRYDPERVGSWILEEAVHFFDLALWYMEAQGDPVSVRAHGTTKGSGPGMYDNFSAVVRFAGDAYATITQCIAGFEHHLVVDVTGSEGAIRTTWSGAMDRDDAPRFDYRIRPRGFPFERGVRESERVDLAASGEVFELVEQIRLTAEGIAEGRPLVSAEESRKRVIMCLEAERAARENREVQLRF